LELINKIRSDPQSFVNDIETAMTNIQEYNNRLIYNGGIKVKLNKGENMFKDAIDYLRKTKSMPPLTLNKEIEIEMPTDEEYKKEKDFFKQKILTKKKENKIERYYREAIKDPYTGVLMMIVDDTSRNQGEKRITILDPLLNKISINCKMYGKKFLAYLTFSK
jgi:predicted ribosome quality control (RQC) complex YloA/Tae2 family protein